MNRESGRDETGDATLLGAVLGNPRLRQMLDRMPADEKTIELSTASGEDFSHPDWKSAASQRVGAETIDLPVEQTSSAAAQIIDKGFVPQRQVTTLTGEKRDDIDYRIVGQLGSGGTGIVYQAHQRAIDREVALKVLRQELAVSEVSRSRFLSEARVIGGLDHPNVIALHEVCVDQSGGLFYSMKRVDGTSWDRQIDKMSLGENIGTLLRVADAIRYAHSRGLIHRDIKPENVMLGQFGEVLVADWGLAISHDSGESTVGIHHSIGGTPAYMAPELASGLHHAISYQTDVYLLGAILFQILTGHPPHDGDSLLACIRAAANNVIRPTDVEGELMDIAMKAMQTDPKDRYESVESLIAIIRSQRRHDESERLVRRAIDRLSRASDDKDYEDLRVADALLNEAIDVWPENQRALETRRKLQLQFANQATSRGDFDLALSIYASAGEAESDAANEVRRLRDRRDASHKRGSRYSALFTQSPEAGLLIDMSNGTVVEANEMFFRTFGYREDDVVGRPVADLNLWACPERRSKLVDELKRTGTIENFEAVFLHTDGRAIDVLISGRVVELHGDKMVVSTIRDISLRKKAENDLKRSRQRLRDLQALAGLATWTYDVLKDETTWSEETFLLTGRRIEEGVPTKEEFFAMLHPEDRDKVRDTIQDAISSGSAYELLIRQRGPSGKYNNVMLRGQPIFDDDGKTVEVYGVLIKQKL